MFSKKSLLIITLILFSFLSVSAQRNKTIEAQIADSLTFIANKYASVGRIGTPVLNINQTDKTITVIASDILSQIPFRFENVNTIYSALRALLDKKYPGYKIVCQSDKQNIEFYIPNYYRNVYQTDLKRIQTSVKNATPLVTNLSKPFAVTSGLQNRHIALWQSHGLYFDQTRKRWTWQRPALFTTVEDLYAQSYVLPFIVPMLENAGANVFLPRERDTQIHEVVVDNDSKLSSSKYRERSDRKNWQTGQDGFSNALKVYKQGENPFRMGTYRYVASIADTDELSDVNWTPQIPETGYYAVYVSYKSLPNSATDARYTVYYKGGSTTFKVNQTMNGGTWTYLGTFKFDKGRSNQGRVELNNYSSASGKVVTADAVKFGGGMGNIGRYPSIEPITTDSAVQSVDSIKPIEPMISGYPRYTEGARYWLQWAGVPDSIYSRTQAKNDYSDDFQSRGFWVNYLAGGSPRIPNSKGLNIPIDMAFALHSDAGSNRNDSIIGSLGICTVNNTIGSDIFQNGVSRWSSRDLVDMVQSQIVSDVRKIAPEWTRRGIWNKSYSESRVPEVPTMLLELLSHQNFADMRYGLDPRFRFTVSRAIYKGILKYMAYMYGFKPVVQPLPVQNMACKFAGKNKVELTWKATTDSIEPTAKPDKYIVYIRIDDNDFNNGVVVKSNRVVIDIAPGKIYSFKVAAINNGGQSFPSEILTAYKANNDKKEILIINGFTRISAPVSFTQNHTTAGFLNETDAGVPYIRDFAYTGKQTEFNRSKPVVSDDNPGFGASNRDFETTVVAGNTFDFPYVHGKAIKAAGYSFVSSSLGAVLDGTTEMQQYNSVDLILGKQKQTYIGNGKKAPEFKTFPLALQQKIRSYCQAGGNLLVSGAYLASDAYSGTFIRADEKLFLENILNISYKQTDASKVNGANMIATPYLMFHRSDFELYNVPNEQMYQIESGNVIEPASKNAMTICRYSDNNQSAGILYNGKFKVCAFGFPLETIKEEKELNKIMESALLFFAADSKKN